MPEKGTASAQLITMAGRFAKEAAVFDPITGSIFITRGQLRLRQRLYRYDPPVRPRRAGRIEDGGTLWMLGAPVPLQANLSGAQVRRNDLSGRLAPHRRSGSAVPDGLWPAHDHEQPGDNVVKQGWDGGGAVFSRLEELTWDKGVIYFTATQGGGPRRHRLNISADR